MNAVQALGNQSERIVAGLMSGTSLDGVDVAIVRINRSQRVQLETIAFQTIPYEKRLRALLLRNSSNDTARLEDIVRLNMDLAEVYANAVQETCAANNINVSALNLIGCHGQTICHLPPNDERTATATFQIGDPSALANITGVPVVGDFRVADVALGGQGAPLVPYFDYLMFHDTVRTRIALNIGGIANISILEAGKKLNDVIAFDTGPGNMVMDVVATRLLNQPYDRGGGLAARGATHQSTVDRILSTEYFRLAPPKSTGREAFGNAFVDEFLNLLAEAGVDKVEDILASAAALTVRSIHVACQQALPDEVSVDELVVSGGGVRNDHVMRGLEEAFTTTRVLTTADFGIDPDAKEAICFAVLANETVDGVPSNVPSATGASASAILGKICLPVPDPN